MFVYISRCCKINITITIIITTRESAFSWCLKKSSMMHDDRTGSLLDAVSLTHCPVSVNDRVDCKCDNSIRWKSNVHFDAIVPNELPKKTSISCICCSNVRITLYRNDVYSISRPQEVSACVSTLKCVVRFETECSRGPIISSRLSTI